MTLIGRSLFIVLIVVGSSTKPAAQTLEIDSLEDRLKVSDDVDKIKILRRLLDVLQYSNTKRSMSFIDEAIRLSSIHNDSVALTRFIRNKAQLWWRDGNFHLIKPLLTPWLPRCKDNPRELGHMLTLIGVADVMHGDYASALDNFEKCLTIPPVPGGIQLRGIYNNIGLVYYKLRDNPKACYFFSKTISTALFNLAFFDEGSAYCNLGLAYGEMGYFQTAEGLIRTGLGLSNKDPSTLLNGHFALGQVKLRQGKWDESMIFLKKTLMIADESDDSRYVAECLALLARIHLEKSRTSEALKLLKRCERICVKFQYKEILLKCYETKVSVFKVTGEVSLEAKYQAFVINLSSILRGREVMERLEVLEMDLRKKNNIRILKTQSDQMKIQTEITASQKTGNYAMVLFCLLLIISTGLIYKSIRAKHLVYERLQLIVRERDNRLQELERNYSKFYDDQIDRLQIETALMVALKCPEGSMLGEKINSEITRLELLTNKLLTIRSPSSGRPKDLAE